MFTSRRRQTRWISACSSVVCSSDFTATFTAAAGTDISNGSVTVDSTWHEANGNLGTGSTSTAFVVDTVTPTASVSVNSSDVNLAAHTPTPTFSFTEAHPKSAL